MGEATAVSSAVSDEAKQICEEIRRISGGTEISYGELAKDDTVTQRYEALMGTLKAARKQGLLDFEGELLLLGQHDSVVISLTGKVEGAAEEPAAEEPAAEEPAAEEPAAEEPAAEEPAAEEPAAKEPAAAETAAEAAQPTPAPAEPAQASAETDQAHVPATSSTGPSATVKKTEEGKWKVDTGYIDHRTQDPNRLESRRSVVEKDDAAPSSAKDETGKFKTVDVSYINHRTGQVDNLDGRKASAGLGAEMAAGHSATVKKESDGKWKIDTSYIGYRTGDPNNLTRKEEKLDEVQYADPAEKKYPWEELKTSNTRPEDVDPARREAYLSDSEFQAIFGVSHADFLKQPKWKQQNTKKAKDLF